MMPKDVKKTIYCVLCSGHSGSRMLVRLLEQNGFFMGMRRGSIGEDNLVFGQVLWNDRFRNQFVARWKYPEDPRLNAPIRARLRDAHEDYISDLPRFAGFCKAAGTKNATVFPHVAGDYLQVLKERGVRVRFIHLTRNPLNWALSGRDPDSRGIVRPARHPRLSLFDDPFNRIVWFGSLCSRIDTPVGSIELSSCMAYSQQQQIALEAALWKTTNTLAGTFARDDNGYMHLRYEDLVRDPRGAFRRLSEFTDVELCPAPPGGTKILDDRVMLDPVEKLGESNAATVMQTCGELMGAYGYETRISRKSIARPAQDARRGHSRLRPVFVVGCMRSGTTILGNLLGRHSLMKQIGWELNEEWTTLGNAPSGVCCEHRHAGHYKEEAAARMAELFRSGIQGLPAGTRPLNKSPHLGNKIRYVDAIFPDAQFVHIIRDPFSHCNSIMKHHEKVTFGQRRQVTFWPDGFDEPCWQQYGAAEAASLPQDRVYPGGGFARFPEGWAVINAYIVRALRELPPSRRIALSYNALVENPQQEMLHLQAFLGLPYEVDTLPDAVLHSAVELVNSQTSDPLNEWKQSLAAQEIQIIEQVLARHEFEVNIIEQWLLESRSPAATGLANMKTAMA